MLDRLAKLDENVGVLEAFRQTGIHDKRDEWAVRYGLLESIQIVIDISCELVAKRNLGNPANYRECVGLLALHELIDNDIAERLSAMVGLRNLLVHEYDDIDPRRLSASLDELDDFRAFAQAVAALSSE